MGVGLPGDITHTIDESNYNPDYMNDWLVSSYWRVILLVPAVIAALQSLMLITCFNFGTPTEMKKEGDHQRLLHLMRRIYKTEGEVNLRIGALGANEQKTDGASEEYVSYGQVLTDPRFRTATFAGYMTMTFAQLSGMNSVMFYGTNIFADTSISPFIAQVIINGFNWLATLFSMLVLSFTGRRPAMIFAQCLCTIGMVFMFLFEGPFENSTALLAVVLVFILGFELGPGSIGWPFLGEVCHPKAMSIAVGANWFWTLVVAATFLPMKNWLNAGVFLIYGGISFFGIIFFIIYFKETKGKSREECQRIFRKDAAYSKFQQEEIDHN